MPRTHISMGDAGITPRSVTRRDALRLFMGAGICATFFPAVARAETTQEKLDAAQMSFEDAQAELDRIGQETAEVAGRLSETQVQISELNAQIDQTQADIESKQGEIDERQAQIEEKQKRLGERMTSAYKSGTQGTLDLILSATTFDELTSSIFYLDKVSESEREMIDEVKTLKAELETSKAELEGQKTELEAQRADLEELQAQQQEDRVNPPALSVLFTITSALPENASIFALFSPVSTVGCWNLSVVDGFPLSTPTISPLPVRLKRMLFLAELTNSPFPSSTSTEI